MTTVHERYAKRRKLRMAIRLGTIAVLLGGYLAVFLWPRITAQAQLDQAFQESEAALQRLRMEEQALERADASRRERERQQRELDRAVPEDRVEIEAMAAIEAAATRAGVRLVSQKPLPERKEELPGLSGDAGGSGEDSAPAETAGEEGDPTGGASLRVCMARPIEIRGSGEFSQILAFVEALEESSLLLRLTVVEVERTEGAAFPALEFRVALEAFAMRTVEAEDTP